MGAATAVAIRIPDEERRVDGEVDAACITLEHAFALGLTLNHHGRSNPEFPTLQGDWRFAVPRAKSEICMATQREEIATLLPATAASPSPVDIKTHQL